MLERLVVVVALAVEELLARTRDATTSSRLQLQLQVIALIDDLFIAVLPVPTPLTTPTSSSSSSSSDLWHAAVAQQVQLVCLQRVHRLTLTYATVWQAIERPTRNHDAQRSLVALVCTFVVCFSLFGNTSSHQM